MHLISTALPGVSLLQAELAAHRFDKHVHDTYSFGITLSGVQSFNCKGSRFANTPGHVITFNPDEAHDGEPGTLDGFSYRMIYVSPDVIRGITEHRNLPYFKTSSVLDLRLTQQFRTTLDAAQPQELLRAGTLLQDLLLTITKLHGCVDIQHNAAACNGRARMMRDYLQAHSENDISTAELAQVAGVSRIHANRIFTAAFGIAPHAYLNALRVLNVKRLIEQGQTLCVAALQAGFADQAHMSRRFRASVGVSPSDYKRSIRPPHSG